MLHEGQQNVLSNWLYKATLKYYGTKGQESIDSVVFFKLTLIGYLENLSSNRRIINFIKTCQILLVHTLSPHYPF